MQVFLYFIRLVMYRVGIRVLTRLGDLFIGLLIELTTLNSFTGYSEGPYPEFGPGIALEVLYAFWFLRCFQLGEDFLWAISF